MNLVLKWRYASSNYHHSCNFTSCLLCIIHKYCRYPNSYCEGAPPTLVVQILDRHYRYHHTYVKCFNSTSCPLHIKQTPWPSLCPHHHYNSNSYILNRQYSHHHTIVHGSTPTPVSCVSNRHYAHHYACTTTATPTPVCYTLNKQYGHPYTNHHSYMNLSTLYQCIPAPPLQLQLQSLTYWTDNIAIIIAWLKLQRHLLYHMYEPGVIVTICIIKLTSLLQLQLLTYAK